MSDENIDPKVIIEFLRKLKQKELDKKLEKEKKKEEKEVPKEIINRGDNIQQSQGLELEIKRTITKSLESNVAATPVSETKEQANVNYTKPEEGLYIPYASYQKTYTLTNQEKEVNIKEEEIKKKRKSSE